MKIMKNEDVRELPRNNSLSLPRSEKMSEENTNSRIKTTTDPSVVIWTVMGLTVLGCMIV
jgi:hypothetical protein